MPTRPPERLSTTAHSSAIRIGVVQRKHDAARAEADRLVIDGQGGAGDGRIGVQPAERVEVPLGRPHRREAVLVGEPGAFEQERGTCRRRSASSALGEVEQAEVDRAARATAPLVVPVSSVEHDLEAARQGPEQLEHRDVEREAGHRQPGSRRIVRECDSSMPAKKFVTLRCSTITPLGLPVEPEV